MRNIKTIGIAAAVAASLLAAPVAANAATHKGYVSDVQADSSLTARVQVSDPVTTKGGTRVYLDVYYAAHGGSFSMGDSNYLVVESRSGYYFEMPDLSYVSANHERASVIIAGSDPVGAYDVRLRGGGEIVTGYDPEYGWEDTDYYSLNDDQAVTFYPKRRTTATLNVAPEPIRRNTYATAKGHMTKLYASDPWTSNYWVFAKAKVGLYFDPKGSSPRRYVTTTYTNSHGDFAKNVKVTGPGVWTAHYPGSGTYASVWSNGDSVATK